MLCSWGYVRRTLMLNVKVFPSIHMEFQSEATKRVRSMFTESDITNTVNLTTSSLRRSVPHLLHYLQTCARKGLLLGGKCCHSCIIQAGIQNDSLASNMLINMYSKCGCIISARAVFNRMMMRTMVSWNTIISAYTQSGDHKTSLELFMQMRLEGTAVSEFTLSSVLCACAAKSAIIECKQLHAMALKISTDYNVFVGTSLLDVYAKCALVEDASLVFYSMPTKSSVTWSSMIAGYVQNGLYEKALSLFHITQKLDLERTQFTLSSALNACASLAAMIEGAQLHSVIVRTAFDVHLFVTTSLIDVYSRCGCIEEAFLIFKNANERSIAVWNVMIAGYARHARASDAFRLFEKLKQTAIKPSEVTYLSVLSACSHAGLVEKGQNVFTTLMRDNRLQPNVLHYSCMVDILGRAGLIYEAWNLIHRMPFKATASIWGSLLGSCRNHGYPDLAKVAAQHLFEIEPDNAGNHVLLANIYAASKRWEDVAAARKLLKESGAKKEMGKSWIEVKNKVHTFVVGDANHPRIQEVYDKIDYLDTEMKKMAYKTETESDLHDVGEDDKRLLLRHHSEKLALAFGLLTLPSGISIRIHKNLRVCGDCHSFMKFSSVISGRKIILRDTNRFHHFDDGSCSCNDFW